MQIVETQYTTLKAIRHAVIEFIQTECLVRNVSASTTIEAKLRVTGDDALELLETFEERFQTDLTGLNFCDYFVPEGDYLSTLLGQYLIVYPVLYLIYPFRALYDLNGANQLFHDYNYMRAFRKSKELTVGDLIVSALVGKFTLRSSVRLCLKQ
ncbi:hypothetical protein GCM10027341_22690 [Spirosoma knui]